jgi:hypothetical protein
MAAAPEGPLESQLGDLVVPGRHARAVCKIARREDSLFSSLGRRN